MMWKPVLFALIVATTPAFGQIEMDALVSTKRSLVPSRGEVVTVNIAVIGSTVTWIMDERGFQQAKVEALTVIEQEGRIVDYRKTLILSPQHADTLQRDLLHQESFLLRPGPYELSVELHDENSADTSHLYVHMPLPVADRGTGVSISDIQLMEPLDDPNGTAVPFSGSYYPPYMDKLNFYAEIYGTEKRFGKDGPFILYTQIEDDLSHAGVGAFKHVQRLKADTVVMTGQGFSIAQLPSGNYLLALEVRDKQDSLIARKEQFFQRNNSIGYDVNDTLRMIGSNFANAYVNPDTLAEFLSSMRPIANELERKMIDDRWKDKKLDLMQSFMYSFWYNRAPTEPKVAWERYHQAVILVNQQFGCRNLRGYQSDQGYIYLRYGAPNTMVDRANDLNTLPYSIWHYYRAGNYTNRKFVFYQPERSTTCWTLLHSDMPGEIMNGRWLDIIVPANADGGYTRNEVLNNFNNPH